MRGKLTIMTSPFRFLVVHGLFTTSYMSLIILALFHFKYVYDIGKYSTWPLMCVFALMEWVKLILLAPPNLKNVRSRRSVWKHRLRCIPLLLAMLGIYYLLAILFGAVLYVEHEETFMFAVLLTTLTVIPSCFNLGPDGAVTILCSLTTYQNDLMSELLASNTCYTLMGAWIGAVGIPLDWGRPWQVWPIPCSLGSILGYLFGHVLCLFKLIPKFSKIFVKKTGKYGL